MLNVEVLRASLTRILCVQVGTRPIWDGLDAALRCPLTRHFIIDR